MTTYYKVVNKELKSPAILAKELQVQYKVGEWVEPPGFRLYVFTDLDAAKTWLGCSEEPDKIYECEVQDPIDFNIDDLMSFAASRQYNVLGKQALVCVPSETSRVWGFPTNPPPATKVVSSVKLLRQVA